MSQILDNYLRVRELVDQAARKAGRDPKQVRVVAVSKTKSFEMMHELQQALERRAETVTFGENYVQEFKAKQELFGSAVDCHLIGPLQSNKAKDAVKLFSMIESVHSSQLAKVLDKEAKKISKRQRILLQINISSDQQKSGFEAEQALEFINNDLLRCDNLEFRGLMTITRLYPQAEMARADFHALRELTDKISALLGPKAPQPFELSMGMSADFHVAVEEGATLVRVGTAIFGER